MKYFNKMTKSRKLLKYSFVKDKIKKNKDHLKSYKIDLPVKNELDYFYFEMFTTALNNKELLEAKFIDAYDDMRDYWSTLTYQQKQHLINIELLQVKENMPFIKKDEDVQYIPFFDDRMNRIYSNEMVLFELKQYNALRFDFKSQIKNKHFTQEMADPGFTCLKLIKSYDTSYYAYASCINTLFHMNKQEILHSYQFDTNVSDEMLIQIIEYIQSDDEKNLLKYIIEYQLLNEKKCNRINNKLRNM